MKAIARLLSFRAFCEVVTERRDEMPGGSAILGDRGSAVPAARHLHGRDVLAVDAFVLNLRERQLNTAVRPEPVEGRCQGFDKLGPNGMPA
jgi:hypothetical protein